MKYSWFLIVLFFAFSCNNNSKNEKTNFIVYGTVENAPENTYVKLFYKTSSQIEILDSVLIKNNKFELKSKTSELDFFGIEISDNTYNVFLLLDSGDNVIIHADYYNLQMYSVENSPSSVLIQNLENQLFETNEIIRKKIAENDSFYNQIQEQKIFSSNFIKENSYSPACIIAFSQKIVGGEIVLPIEDYFDLYKNIEKKLRANYNTKEFFQNFESFINKYELLINRNKKIEKTERPEKIVDFTVQTVEGKEVSFEKIAEGNAVLLNFWASWCIDCVENNRIIAKIEQKYPNIKIVQISLDSDEGILMDTLKKYKFKHVLINQLLVWDSEIVALYAIEKLPTNILINSKGEIVLYSTETNELMQKIGQLK